MRLGHPRQVASDCQATLSSLLSAISGLKLREFAVDQDGTYGKHRSRILFCFYPLYFILPDTENRVALSDLDRELIKGCMEGDPRAWSSFCDRFAGLVLDVADETLAFAGVSGPDRSGELREEMVEAFFRESRSNGFSMLRAFRGESSLATYLAVVARRSILGQLSRRDPVYKP
jgi:hypothetical protein